MTNQNKEPEVSDTRNIARGYSSVTAAEELSVIEKVADNEVVDEDTLLEDLRV